MYECVGGREDAGGLLQKAYAWELTTITYLHFVLQTVAASRAVPLALRRNDKDGRGLQLCRAGTHAGVRRKDGQEAGMKAGKLFGAEAGHLPLIQQKFYGVRVRREASAAWGGDERTGDRFGRWANRVRENLFPNLCGLCSV